MDRAAGVAAVVADYVGGRNVAADAADRADRADAPALRRASGVGETLGTSTRLCVLPSKKPEKALSPEDLRLEADRLKYRRVGTMRGLLVGIDNAKRQRNCQHASVKGVDVEIVLEGDKAYTTGLCRCGNEDCAFDAYFEAETNRREIAVLFAQVQKMGGATAFLTLTLAHEMDQTLAVTAGALKDARREVMTSEWWRSLVDRYDIWIVALNEETYGEHGWHPHAHDAVVMFNPPMRTRSVKRCPVCHSEDVLTSGNHAGCSQCGWQGTDLRRMAGAGALAARRMALELVELVELDTRVLDDMQAGFAARYIPALEKRDYTGSRGHAVHLRIADSAAAEYIAKTGHEPFQPVNRKYGADAEMTMGAHAKNPREGGLTPFQLQDAAGDDAAAARRLGEFLHSANWEYIEARAGALAVEHRRFVHGRHKLRWGRRKIDGRWIGLKERVGFAEAFASYEAKTAEIEGQKCKPERVSFCWISDQVWQERVCGDKTGKDLRAELLAVVRTGDAFKLMLWLSDRGIEARVTQAAQAYTLARDEAPPAAPVPPAAQRPPPTQLHFTGLDPNRRDYA